MAVAVASPGTWLSTRSPPCVLCPVRREGKASQNHVIPMESRLAVTFWIVAMRSAWDMGSGVGALCSVGLSGPKPRPRVPEAPEGWRRPGRGVLLDF